MSKLWNRFVDKIKDSIFMKTLKGMNRILESGYTERMMEAMRYRYVLLTNDGYIHFIHPTVLRGNPLAYFNLDMRCAWIIDDRKPETIKNAMKDIRRIQGKNKTEYTDSVLDLLDASYVVSKENCKLDVISSKMNSIPKPPPKGRTTGGW